MDYLNFSEIVKKTKENKLFPLKYLNDLFSYHQNSYEMPIKCANPLAAIKCFVPLPSSFLLSELYSNEHKIIKNKDEYRFHGRPGNRLIFSEKILPFATNGEKLPIPFAFPVPQSEHIEVILSNVFYFEVTIMEQQNLNYDLWVDNSPCVSVGFGDKNTRFNSHVGWYDDSVGFHSDDGTIRRNITNNKGIVVCKPSEPGDTIGTGILFCGLNQIKPFFTLNGKLVHIYNKPFEINSPYFPMIGYDHPNTIQVNFSSKKFKFDIKNFIMENSNNIISTDNSFIANYDISYFLNHTPTNIPKNLKQAKIVFQSGNSLISPINLLNLNISSISNLSATPISTLNTTPGNIMIGNFLFSFDINPTLPNFSANDLLTQDNSNNGTNYSILGIPVLGSNNSLQLNQSNSITGTSAITNLTNLLNILNDFNEMDHDIIFNNSFDQPD